MKIIIIAALAKNNVIGKKGDIPWRIKEDFKRFKEITFGHPCIMGDKTFESLPENARPLPGRENIILTFDKNYQPQGTTVFYSFDDALNYCKEKNYEKVYICGGGFVYKQAIEFADCLELTRIHKDVDGDIFFPEFNSKEWKLVKEEKQVDSKMGDYSFMTYLKKYKTQKLGKINDKHKGKFIVFEGIDGCGKGTQLFKIAKYIFEKDKSINVLCTREPTSGILGNQIRKILSEEKDPLSGAEKCFDLYVQDRDDHCRNVLVPLLHLDRYMEGNYKTIILCDRYWYSTYAYQGTQGIDKQRVIDANKKYPTPDLLLIFDLPQHVSETRRKSRDGEKNEKFEQSDFQNKVRNNYLELETVLSDMNVVIIDASKDIEIVFEETKDAVDFLFN
jgi:dihydrofolate reductase